MSKIAEVYDLESLSNFFSYTGYDYKNNKWNVFIIAPWQNDIVELVKHVLHLGLMIGFNNISYDYPLLHHIINHWKEYQYDPEAAQKIYKKSQKLINMQFSAIAEKNMFVPQVDLYLIWHYNNKARHQSLKGLEIFMKMDNVEEMPIHHTQYVFKDQAEQILSYNKNDVIATYKFLLVTLGKTDYPLYKEENKIKLRLDLNKKFNVNVLNKGDVPMGEELILQLYARAANVNPYKLKKAGGTFRKEIALKDCIPYWYKLENSKFLNHIDFLKNAVVNLEKLSNKEYAKQFSKSIIFHNFKFDLGLGGIHGCCEPQIWESNNNYVIADYDIGSLYPSAAKSLGLYPEHLGKLFLNQYVGFIDRRLEEKHKPKNERDNVLIKGYKLILNGVYGKSKEESSFLYDPLYTYRTTIGGQVFACMWAERMVKVSPTLKFIQANTDGITIYVNRKDLDKIRAVNDQLTKETQLTIEETIYSKMIMRDVNNYIGVYEDNSREHEHLKLKGDYEIDKEFHKDPSMRIVSIAVKDYFIYGIPVEQTIKNHNDIFDFCLQLKCNSGTTPKHISLDKFGNKIIKKLDRTTRYYISNSSTSGILEKHFDDGRIVGVNVGYTTTIFNKYVKKPINEYNIDYGFYISEANKLINVIDCGQLTLF